MFHLAAHMSSSRFLPNPSNVQHPLSSETQKFGTTILDTFNNGTHAEAVNSFLASRNSCRTGHATQRMFVVCTVHLFPMELHPTRSDCPLAFCSLCSSVVVTLERSSGTSATRAFFETETRNCRVFSVLLSAAWRDWRGSLFSTSSLSGRSMCSSADHLGVPTGHCHKFVLTVQIPFRITSSNSSVAEVLCTSANNFKLAFEKHQRAFICFISRHHLISHVPTLLKASRWSRRTSVSRPQLKRTACTCTSLIYPTMWNPN